jgi:Zn-finger nucleic acid-binding protein
MARLKSELEVTCPCCQAVLVVDTNLGRVVEHRDHPNPDRPELSDAQRILADAEARRNALFEQSVQEHKTRGDALSKRFEEALKEAKKEPISKPLRGFDLD